MEAVNPYSQRPDTTATEIEWAKRSNKVIKHLFDRLERLEQAHVEQAEKQSRGTKLSGRTAEIAEELKT